MNGHGHPWMERQLWLPAVDANHHAPLAPWPLPPQSSHAESDADPPRIELVQVAYPCDGWLWGSWPQVARSHPQRVRVVGESASCLRIEACKRTQAPGERWLEAGDTALVPRGAVSFEEPSS